MNNDQDRATTEEIEAFAHRLARQEHLDDPQVQWRRHGARNDASVDVLTNPPRMRISTTLLANPARARAAVAHEIGHLINDRDGSPTRSHLRSTRRVAWVPLVAACICLVVLVLTVFGMISAWILIASLGVTVVGMFAIMRWIGLRQRPFEIAADLHGADLGFPHTPDQFTTKELHPGLSARIGDWLDPSHPAWPDRLATIAAHTS